MNDVLVVGAGPAGAATAFLLAHHGVSVSILDKASFPREKPCAEFMSPGVRSALARLGLLGQITPLAGVPLRGFRLFTAQHTLQADYSSGLTGFAAPRLQFDAALARCAEAAGAVLCEGIRAVGIEQTGHSKRVYGLDKRGHRLTFDARFVVAADGVNSLIGHRLGLRRPYGDLARIGLVTHIQGIAGLSDYGEMHIGRQFYCGLAPFDRETANVAMVLPLSDSAGLKQDMGAYFLRRLHSLPSLRSRLDHARLLKPVQAIGPLAVHALPPWAFGTICVGDAAGFYDPFTGQGIFRALRTAELAANAILDALAGTAPEVAFAHYAAIRRREFAGGWAVERLIQTFLKRPGLLEHVLQRLSQRKGLASSLIAVTGDAAPASRVLNPWYLLRLLR